jgi:hypothetical protein
MISPSSLDKFNSDQPIEIVIEPQDHTEIKLVGYQVIAFEGKEMKVSLNIAFDEFKAQIRIKPEQLKINFKKISYFTSKETNIVLANSTASLSIPVFRNPN